MFYQQLEFQPMLTLEGGQRPQRPDQLAAVQLACRTKLCRKSSMGEKRPRDACSGEGVFHGYVCEIEHQVEGCHRR